MQTEFRKIQTFAFFAVLVGVGIEFYNVVAPFLYPLFWAAVLAALFYPAYLRLQKKIRSENAAASVTVALVVLVVILPLALFFGVVVKQAFDVYNQLMRPATITAIQNGVQDFLSQPALHKLVRHIDINQQLQDASQNAGKLVLDWITASSLSTLSIIFQFFIMLYTLFYFLKNGQVWLQKAMFILPFGDDNERTLYKRFVSTSRATLKGTIIVGGLQGAIGGVFFFIAGIPSGAFWGLVMSVFAMIPAIGTIVIWAPTAVYLLVTGHTIEGFIVLGGGVLMAIVDNLVRPPLIGNDIQMHPVLILFSTIGGLALFGISGVVVGPLIAALFVSLIEIYEKRYKKELSSSET